VNKNLLASTQNGQNHIRISITSRIQFITSELHPGYCSLQIQVTVHYIKVTRLLLITGCHMNYIQVTVTKLHPGDACETQWCSGMFCIL